MNLPKVRMFVNTIGRESFIINLKVVRFKEPKKNNRIPFSKIQNKRSKPLALLINNINIIRETILII